MGEMDTKGMQFGLEFPLCSGTELDETFSERGMRPTLRELTQHAAALVEEIVASSPRVEERNHELHMLRDDISRYGQLLSSDLDLIEAQYNGYVDEDFQALLRMLPEDMCRPELTAESRAIVDKLALGIEPNVDAAACVGHLQDMAAVLYGVNALNGRSDREVAEAAREMARIWSLEQRGSFDTRLETTVQLIIERLRPEPCRARFRL